MAYASTSRYPRESVYPQQNSDYLTSLEDCVQATEACCLTMGNVIEKLAPGISDLPRLSRILQNRHHFLVLPLPAIQSQKTALAATIAPQIDQLIKKAEGLIEVEKARIGRMEERLQVLQSARMPVSTPSMPIPEFETVDENDTTNRLVEIDMKGMTIAQRKKHAMLKSKRDRLEKELSRLQAS
ncbi:DASH complex subunit SPC19, partial [Tremellales sp. Uapishka_1]